MLSAYFILAANSWMQHPVGYVVNHASHRAELKSIFAVLTNSTVLLAFPHTLFGAFTTAGMLVIGICALPAAPPPAERRRRPLAPARLAAHARDGPRDRAPSATSRGS